MAQDNPGLSMASGMTPDYHEQSRCYYGSLWWSNGPSWRTWGTTMDCPRIAISRIVLDHPGAFKQFKTSGTTSWNVLDHPGPPQITRPGPPQILTAELRTVALHISPRIAKLYVWDSPEGSGSLVRPGFKLVQQALVYMAPYALLKSGAA